MNYYNKLNDRHNETGSITHFVEWICVKSCRQNKPKRVKATHGHYTQIELKIYANDPQMNNNKSTMIK